MWQPSRQRLLRAAAGGVLAYALFSLVVFTGALDEADVRLNAWVERNVGDTLLGVRWSAITAVGATFTATAAVCVSAFLAWRSGAWRTALVIALLSLSGGVLVDGLKTLHGRPYPPHGGYTFLASNATDYACPPEARCDLVFADNSTAYCAEGARCNYYVLNETAARRVNATYVPPDLETFPARQGRAYPSGHTMGATLSWGLALLLGTRAVQRSKGFDPWAVRAWLAVAFLGGLSRVPVHAHWWTDVVGSWLLGGAFVALGILLDDRMRERAGR